MRIGRISDAYLQPCRALGHDPMPRDRDADEVADDGQDAGAA